MKNKLKHIKKTGFQIPKAYFDTLEDTFFDKIKSKELSKQEGFIVPENYLKTIEDKVLARIENEEKTVKLINFKKNFLKKVLPIAVAASLLLFIFIKSNTEPTVFPIDNLTTTEIEHFIENNLITLDTYEIAEIYSDVELENQYIFDEKEMLDYLNGIDIEDLILEN